MSSNSSIESILDKEGFYIFTGNGNSMWPLVREGVDTVEVRPVVSKLSVGDVVLFRAAEDKYILHRILEVNETSFITRGDNNYATEIVSREDVIAVMTGLWRGERKIRRDSLTYRLYKCLCLNHPRLFKFLRKLCKR